ncbi:hypothetical protein BDA99DRAFT_497977 [Phascolomyces articulosus]|uniref:Uncharacterized protein n=1 Tax=Phascolomyces articulosus TaxID=60185 RepID=A0AAD5K910_9FUNG|nr:hypothetical protein BDA99DRAFT_497977 [Phascolomyces articulosus]
MKSFQLILFTTMLLSLYYICNAQIEKNEFDATVDSTDLHLQYGSSPESEQHNEQDVPYHDNKQQEQQTTLTLPPASPPTLMEQIITQIQIWRYQTHKYLEQRFPRCFELLAHVHQLTEQARQEQQVAGRRYYLLTWDDIYFDLRRLVPWWPFFADETSLITTDTVTRRRTIAEIVKNLRPRSLQQDATIMQVRLLHWTTEAAERSIAMTHQLATFYDDKLNQLSQLAHGLLKRNKEEDTALMLPEIRQLLLRTGNQGLALSKEMSRFIDAEFAKTVWLSGPLRPWLEEVNAASITGLIKLHKEAMDESVSDIRNKLAMFKSKNSMEDDNSALQQDDLAVIIQAAVNQSKQRAEQAFAQAEKQLKAIWENTASEIRPSPWTAPYWKDAFKDTVVATKSRVLGVKSIIQRIFARLAGCECGATD